MINFFCERHGKNSRDAHFSNVSRFLKHESYKRRLISASSVNTAILERQRSSNEERENSGKYDFNLAPSFILYFFGH